MPLSIAVLFRTSVAAAGREPMSVQRLAKSDAVVEDVTFVPVYTTRTRTAPLTVSVYIYIALARARAATHFSARVTALTAHFSYPESRAARLRNERRNARATTGTRARLTIIRINAYNAARARARLSPNACRTFPRRTGHISRSLKRDSAQIAIAGRGARDEDP